MKSVVGAKVYGQEDLMAGLLADACIYAMPKNTNNFNTDNIRTQKVLGGSLIDSVVVHGMVVLRASMTSVTNV